MLRRNGKMVHQSMTALRCYEAQRKLDRLKQSLLDQNVGYGLVRPIEDVQEMLDEAIRRGLRRGRTQS